MRIRKNLQGEQENILRFLDVLGKGLVELSSKKRVRPDFFILAHEFIQGQIEGIFFQKENLLIKVLEDNGFPTNNGPVGLLVEDQKKSRDAAVHILNAAQHWKAGDELGRGDVIWATSEYTSTLRQHFDRLQNLVFPLLEQTIPVDDEHKISEKMSKVAADTGSDPAKSVKQIEKLEDELSDWL
jgi:hemerythrin-like domain-containing protein